MNNRKRIRNIVLFSILCVVAILRISAQVKAATEARPDYHFEINAAKVANGAEFELKTTSGYVYAVADGWAAPTTVNWTSSEPGVVALESTPSTNCERMVRKGPGYSSITANIIQDGYTYTISFMVKVDLEVDNQNTGTITALTTKAKILVLDTIGKSKQIYVKYKDYTDNSSSVVTGSAISASALTFDSDNTGVATVDENGLVTAVGAGSATITISSSTMSTKDDPLSTTLRVVVSPNFNITYDNTSGTKVLNSASSDNDPNGIYTGVPSDFVVKSNATVGDNLIWVVYHDVGNTRTKVAEGKSSLMTYMVNNSGTVSFNNVKTGTYEIYAFASKDYDENAKAPYSYMKIYVPISINDLNIVMDVGDTYNLMDNSNITDTKLFVAPSGYDTNIAKFDASNYVITAKRTGTVYINLAYDTDQKLFEGMPVNDIQIKVTVIDSIALSESSAAINTKGTLQLEAIVTDSKSAITWSSSNDSIAKVVDGLVTGVKAGTATITAQQTINGVVKIATCFITVQQSVDSITINPSTASLAINGYTTIHATVSPKDLTGVSLTWRSSNDKVVAITESSALTATIQGISGGTAVISAINQDNVVVGYCAVTVRQPVTKIELSETAVTANLTVKEVQLRATVYPDNALNKDVIWSSTDTTKATVDANGLVTLVKTGTVTIVASSKDNPAVVAYCNINILVPVVSVALDTTMKTMYMGETAKLTYTILPANSSNSTVTWTTTNQQVVTVDTTGKVTAKGVGTAVIILRTADGGYASYCTITVKLVATTVKFDVTTLTLKTGDYRQIKTTLTPNGSTDNDLIWQSSDTKIATVDTDGKVVAKSAGTCIIMARTEAGGVATCTVTVTQGVTGLVLNYSDKTIYKGAKVTLEASITPSTATKLEVTWKSSNSKVATIDSKGEVTGIAGGVTVITCTTTDGGYTATCVVTVKETVTSIKLNHSSYKLGIGKKVKLVAKVSSETATNQNVKWTSSNSKVASVSSTGKVTGIKTGNATITATAQDGSEVEATCDIRVVHLVSRVKLSRSTLTMYVGDSKKIKATISPKTATYKTAKWSTSDASIAIVQSDGTIIGIKAGSVMITAQAIDSSGKKAICYVSVYNRVASTSVTLQDKAITMVPGESKKVELVLNPTASTDKVTWSTDNAAVATVGKTSGKITAKSTGTAYITVMTESGKTASVEVTVIGLNVTKLVTEEYTTYSQALSVEGATGTVAWQSSNPLVAKVSSDGTISTRAVGTAIITATINGRKLKCTVIVKKMS